MAKQMIIPVFIPHQGCANDCVFCNQRKIAGDFQIPDGNALRQQVLSYRDSVADRQDCQVQLAFYGGSFTGLDKPLQEQLLGYAQDFKQQGLIQKIRMSTRPDYIDDGVIERLGQYGVDIVELGVQSLSNQVLAASKRGHQAQHVYQANQWLRQTDIAVGMQLMIGLPEDTPDISLASACQVAELRPDFVRLYPTVVIKETELAQMWQAGRYSPWQESQVLETVAQMVQVFQRAHIPVIRIGLQATDNLALGKDILAGMYHPAMGELVKSYLFRQQIVQQLSELSNFDDCNLNLICHPKDYSQVTGQKKSNLAFLKDKHQLKVNIVTDDKMERGQVKVALGHQ